MNFDSYARMFSQISSFYIRWPSTIVFARLFRFCIFHIFAGLSLFLDFQMVGFVQCHFPFHDVVSELCACMVLVVTKFLSCSIFFIFVVLARKAATHSAFASRVCNCDQPV